MLARTDGGNVVPTQKLAAEVLQLLEENTISEKSALREYFTDKTLDYRIRGSVHAYVFEVAKRRNYIDFILQKSLGFRNLGSVNPFIRNLLRIAIYEMFFKGVHPALATDSAVRIAKEINPKAAGFVNAILRNAEKLDVESELEKIRKRSRRKYLALKYFHPEWYIKFAEKTLPDFENLLIANLNQTLYVRANTIRISPENLWRLLEGQGVNLEETVLPEVFRVVSYEKPLTLLDGYDRDFVLQDLGSALVSHALSPEPGDVVVDLAAAPGSKTSHISAMMENRGKIIAVDNSKERVERMRLRMKKLGIRNVEIRVGDGSKFKAQADKVLLDAPCSSTGSVRGYPYVKWRYEAKKFQSLLKLQRKMLTNALRIGDEVVYSTCSITFEENEGNLLKLKELFSIDALNLPIGVSGIRKYGTKTFPHADRVVRLYPHMHDTSGFFISKMKKI
ncbi:transcription antitermination factor NusB [Geoglobus acetivorans]|uniref:RsmB/NOP family class I SAM-dependent RNA methyltransferase n=1 Tax=Geoglobus acetivorans TaxID=565033 RepID=A0ABZ3H1S5_GEOAI|nr:RsmB/NOP family class I SAM-dependent RNA methyltransferase [Geoglobus acetivorans]